MKPITIDEFKGSFCKFTESNYNILSKLFEKDVFQLRKGEIKYMFITNDFKICCTYLSKRALKKLNLRQIKLIDGFWYFKSDLK